MLVFLNLLDTADEKAKFVQLYNSYKDLLYWIARKKVKNAQDAEDCVQETFLYIAKNMHKIADIDSKRTKAYLSTIVMGFAIDIYKKSMKNDFISIACETELYNEADELQCFDEYGKIELLTVFDEVLDEESKVLLYLKYIYGYKSSEIAELYNVKDSYIRKRLQYSREKIKKALKERS